MSELLFIGEFSTPYKTLQDCPKNIQADGPICTIQIFDEYKDGLYGLEVGQKIVVIYWLNDNGKIKRTVSIGSSHHASGEYGTFAKRSPARPNPLGLGVLEIVGINDTVISVKGLDCLDGTKLLDIKPAIAHEAKML